MTSRMSGHSRSSSSSRITPLMLSSFSRLMGSANSSLDGSVESGYGSQQSSFNTSHSYTSLSTAQECTQVYCSTPITGEVVVPRQTALPQSSLETPVQLVSSRRVRYSEDRIPVVRSSLSPTIEEEDLSFDILSCLIRSGAAPPVRKILSFLNADDLMRLAQVSQTFCQSVCDDPTSLGRLSRFLISARQNAENRLTSTHNSRTRPANNGVLRSIENLLDSNSLIGNVWTIPSPLEDIDLDRVPSQFKSLVNITKGLSELESVTLCRTCRRFVPVRRHRMKKPIDCSNCKQKARRGEPTDRAVGPAKKKLLFSSVLR